MLDNYEYKRDSASYPSWWHTVDDRCPPHFHRSVELVYVYEGELTANLNGKVFSVRENYILIVPSYTVHYFTTEAHSQSLITVIPLDFVPVFSKMMHNKTFLGNLSWEDPENSEIVRCLTAISQSRRGAEMNKPVIKGYFYVILGLLSEKLGLAEIDMSAEQTLTREILLYLQSHYCSPLTLESVAAHFGYSKSRFSHIFNDLFGCGIHQYITSLRCRYAASLMVEENVPLIDAAMSSGFDSMRTFYRSFKMWFGTTPTLYCENYPASRKQSPKEIECRTTFYDCFE